MLNQDLELFQKIDKDGGFAKIRDIYLRRLNRLKKENPVEAKKELEFWNKLSKLDWDTQKQYIFLKFKRDKNIPELENLKAKYINIGKKEIIKQWI